MPTTTSSRESVTVLDEYARLDKAIRTGEQSLMLADKLKELKRWKPQWDAEFVGLREQVAAAKRARDWLDRSLARYSAAQRHA